MEETGQNSGDIRQKTGDMAKDITIYGWIIDCLGGL